MSTEPHPLSKTDNGGKIIANKTRNKDIVFSEFRIYCFYNLRSLNMILTFNDRFSMCPEQDSNLHASQHSHLKRARLPFRHPGFYSGIICWLIPKHIYYSETDSLCSFKNASNAAVIDGVLGVGASMSKRRPALRTA